jgi:murein DD-endopeptidase MepM/ murein hydrolase activator NlpD
MVAASAAALLALGTVSVPLSFADELKDRQKQVEKKIDHAKDDVHASSARLRRANARLEAAQRELDGAQSRLAVARSKLAVARERDRQMQEALDAARERLASAREELAAGREDVGEQQRVVAGTISDIYQEGDPELLAFAGILDAQTPADLTRQAEVRNVIVGRETRAYDQLAAAEVLLEVRERQVEEAKEQVAVRRQEAADNLVEKRQLEGEAQDAAAEVRVIVGERASARKAADRARAADLRTLAALKREQAQIEERLRRIAERALRTQAPSSTPDPGGFLSYPTNGGVTSPFGYRRHPIYGYWGMHDGVDFGPGCGAPIQAAGPGRVVASYWSDVYGRRLIISHGAVGGVGLATIYNHASGYNVGVGASVGRGQTIGYVGNTGWSTGCHLHFTVTSNGSSVNPMNWF